MSLSRAPSLLRWNKNGLSRWTVKRWFSSARSAPTSRSWRSRHRQTCDARADTRLSLSLRSPPRPFGQVFWRSKRRSGGSLRSWARRAATKSRQMTRPLRPGAPVRKETEPKPAQLVRCPGAKSKAGKGTCDDRKMRPALPDTQAAGRHAPDIFKQERACQKTRGYQRAGDQPALRCQKNRQFML